MECLPVIFLSPVIVHQRKKLTTGKLGKNNIQFPNHEHAGETALCEFVSTAALKPQPGAVFTRVNLSLTNDELERSDCLQQKLPLSRVEIFRAGLQAPDCI